MPSTHDIGSMDKKCIYCGALLWFDELYKGTITNPTATMCCSRGTVALPPLNPTPVEIKSFLKSDTDIAKNFRKNIRAYNGAFCFTSFGAELDRDLLARGGVYTFRIHGAVYHRIGSLLPVVDARPKYSQVYVYDTDNELSYRQYSDKTKPETLLALQQVIHQVNPFIARFKSMVEFLRTSENVSDNIRMVLRPNGRRYDAPTASEVGMIFDENNHNTRDVVVYGRSDRVQTIPELSPLYDPLHYVLMFPEGKSN
jgi:hypothetical protein